MQGEEILKRFEELLAENVSLYIAASMPTLAMNSTDLELLERKGNYLTQRCPLNFSIAKMHLR